MSIHKIEVQKQYRGELKQAAITVTVEKIGFTYLFEYNEISDDQDTETLENLIMQYVDEGHTKGMHGRGDDGCIWWIQALPKADDSEESEELAEPVNKPIPYQATEEVTVFTKEQDHADKIRMKILARDIAVTKRALDDFEAIQPDLFAFLGDDVDDDDWACA